MAVKTGKFENVFLIPGLKFGKTISRDLNSGELKKHSVYELRCCNYVIVML